MTLTNNGTITEQNAGGLNIYDSITLNNALGGVFEITGTGGLVYGNFASSVTNAGTFIIAMSGSGGVVGAGLPFTNTSSGIVELTTNVTATFNGAFNNQGGTVAATAGTLVFNGGGVSTGGVYNASLGAVIDLTGGQHDNGPGVANSQVPIFTGVYSGFRRRHGPARRRTA